MSVFTFREVTFSLISILPRRLISRFIGLVASTPIPKSLRVPLLGLFADRYGVKLEEAAKPLVEYDSLLDFFTRDIKSGCRPLGEGLVSPVDGVVTAFGEIKDAGLLQAKGKYYRVDEFLGDNALAECFDGGCFLTIYLAPGDYHHIHSPVSGNLKQTIHIPGDLWPVNELSVQKVDGLFCKNERVISILESEFGFIAVVKVGATNVGSITSEFCDVTTNRWLSAKKQIFFPPAPVSLRAGQRMASFRLGSTVVLLLQKNRFRPKVELLAKQVCFGESLGDKQT